MLERTFRVEDTDRGNTPIAGATIRRARNGTRPRSHATALTDLAATPLVLRVLILMVIFSITMVGRAVPAFADSIADCVAAISTPTLVTSLHVQPDAGYTPILDEIDHARCSIDISMYLFTSEEIIVGLQYAEQRGIRVRVILERVPFGTYGTQQDIFETLIAIGAEVQWSSDVFTFSHAKYMIIDSSVLMVTNQNFTGAGFNSNREFGVITTEPAYVSEATQIFASDWNGTPPPTSFSHLVVSPTNSRESILSLIDGSRVSLWMYAEVLRDEEITAALDRAVARGVDVRLLVNPSTSDEDAPYFLDALDHGVQIRVMKTPYVHSKAMMVDGNFALIGSQNYSFTSLNLNREVGMVLTDIVSLDLLTSTFLNDWTRAEPVDSISHLNNGLTLAGRVGKLTSGRWGVV